MMDPDHDEPARPSFPFVEPSEVEEEPGIKGISSVAYVVGRAWCGVTRHRHR